MKTLLIFVLIPPVIVYSVFEYLLSGYRVKKTSWGYGYVRK